MVNSGQRWTFTGYWWTKDVQKVPVSHSGPR